MTGFRQGGAALIIVLMLFAVIAGIAVEVLYHQDGFRASTQSLIDRDRRYQYAMAAEVVAMQGLLDDLGSDREDNAMVDSCDERWAINLPPSPYEDALISATVQDLQGRFNLNWLVNAEADQYLRDDDAREGFQRLLSGLLATPDQASVLSHEMTDWIDSNNLVDGVEGGEDAEYRHRRTPNIPVAHESELRALRSMEPALIPPDRIFWGYLTALPLDVPVNINTAPPLVLDAVLGFAGPGAADAVVKLRREDEITGLQALYGVAPFKELSPDDRNRLQRVAAVNSEYFQVMVDIQLDEARTRLVTRLHRPGQGETRVISRQLVPVMGPLEPPCNPHYNGSGNNNGN